MEGRWIKRKKIRREMISLVGNLDMQMKYFDASMLTDWKEHGYVPLL